MLVGSAKRNIRRRYSSLTPRNPERDALDARGRFCRRAAISWRQALLTEVKHEWLEFGGSRFCQGSRIVGRISAPARCLGPNGAGGGDQTGQRADLVWPQ